jgi:hypothetical protein
MFYTRFYVKFGIGAFYKTLWSTCDFRDLSDNFFRDVSTIAILNVVTPKREFTLGVYRKKLSPLTEVSTRNISWGVKAAVGQGWQPYHLHVPIFLKFLCQPWTLNSLNRPVSGCFTSTFTLYCKNLGVLNLRYVMCCNLRKICIVVWTNIRLLLIIKPTRCTSFSNLFLE